ncbi:MAG: hypothetical protein H0U74_03410 [Bradymonadaceae bacterium]|nr:hypothetical protein [Lujinxingiaceae bacterium]
MKGCLGCLGLVVVAFCAMMGVALIADIILGTGGALGTNLGLIVFMAIIGTGAGVVAWKNVKHLFTKSAAITPQEEHRVLALAAHNGGRLTVEEVAVHCHMPVDQSRRLLDGLVLNQVADTWISENGNLVYVFRGLLGSDKQSARDPFGMLE